MEEEEEERVEEEEEEERNQDNLSCSGVSRASSEAVLLSEPRNILQGFVNPSFSQDDSPPGFRSRPSSYWKRPMKSPRLACVFRDRPYCRSLSSSVENMTFSGEPLSQTVGSPSLHDPANKVKDERETKRSDFSLQSSWRRGNVAVLMQRLENRVMCVGNRESSHS